MTKSIAILIAYWALATAASAHPANIPVARAKVALNGQIELTMQFDVLAYILDEDPMAVLDPPMNALLDGPIDDLKSQLDDAEARFEHGLKLNGAVDKIDFPTAEAIHKIAEAGPAPRLPVMAEVTVRCHLAAGTKTTEFEFPNALGSVVLTTEFPYREPISEQVDPGKWSTPQAMPTSGEVEKEKAAVEAHLRGAPNPAQLPDLDATRVAIQTLYDRWEKAYMAHDVPTLLDILAPDYTLKTAKGTVITRPQYEVMLNIRKQKHDDTTQYKSEILRITLNGNTAACWSRETTSNPRKDPATGTVDPQTYQHDYVDVWSFTDGKWRLASTVTQKEQKLSKTSEQPARRRR